MPEEPHYIELDGKDMEIDFVPLTQPDPGLPANGFSFNRTYVGTGTVRLTWNFFCTPDKPHRDAMAHLYWQIVRLNEPHPSGDGRYIQTRRCRGCGLEMQDMHPYQVVDIATTDSGHFLGWLVQERDPSA